MQTGWGFLTGERENCIAWHLPKSCILVVILCLHLPTHSLLFSARLLHRRLPLAFSWPTCPLASDNVRPIRVPVGHQREEGRDWDIHFIYTFCTGIGWVMSGFLFHGDASCEFHGYGLVFCFKGTSTSSLTAPLRHSAGTGIHCWASRCTSPSLRGFLTLIIMSVIRTY